MSNNERNSKSSSKNGNLTVKKSKSNVWDHFELSEFDSNKVKCKHCPKHKPLLAYINHGTSNLYKHLKSQHKSVIETNDNNLNILDMIRANFSQPALSREVLENILVKWVVQRNYSFLEVESTEFQELIKALRPNISLFSADSLKRRIKSTFSEKRKEVMALIESLNCNVI